MKTGGPAGISRQVIAALRRLIAPVLSRVSPADAAQGSPANQGAPLCAYEAADEPDALRDFGSLDSARQQLSLVISDEKAQAKEKIQNPWQWHSVGPVQMQAVLEAEAVILFQFGKAQDAPAFCAACFSALDSLAQQWREDPFDEDGFGAATIEAIKFTLLARPPFQN